MSTRSKNKLKESDQTSTKGKTVSQVINDCSPVDIDSRIVVALSSPTPNNHKPASQTTNSVKANLDHSDLDTASSLKAGYIGARLRSNRTKGNIDPCINGATSNPILDTNENNKYNKCRRKSSKTVSNQDCADPSNSSAVWL